MKTYLVRAHNDETVREERRKTNRSEQLFVTVNEGTTVEEVLRFEVPITVDGQEGRLVIEGIDMAQSRSRRPGFLNFNVVGSFNGGEPRRIELNISPVGEEGTAEPVPTDCVMTAWSPWPDPADNAGFGACIAVEGGGLTGEQSRFEERTRTIVAEPTNGGAACGPTYESRTITRACTLEALPPTTAPTAPTETTPTGAPAPEVTVTTHGLTAAIAGVQPFQFGYGFKQGQVPASAGLHGATSVQFRRKRSWPDGSAKFGIFNGTATFTVGQKIKATIFTQAAPAETDLTVAAVIASAPVATVVCTHANGDIRTYSLANAMAGSSVEVMNGGLPEVSGAMIQPSPGYNPRVHFAGPEAICVEWILEYSLHVALHVAFYVTYYKSGKSHVYISIRNGAYGQWTGMTYSAEVTVGTTSVYTLASRYHRPGQHWQAQGWSDDVDPGFQPYFDTVYLRDTKLVPNFDRALAVPDSATLDKLYQTYRPFSTGQFAPNMTAASGRADIGVLPLWDALFITSNGDPRAYRSVIAHAETIHTYGLGLGRDKATRRGVNPASYPTLNFQAKAVDGASNGGMGDSTNKYDVYHAPSAGYLAYLLTGQPWHQDTQEITASWMWAISAPSWGSGTDRVLNKDQVRGHAWGPRNVGQALILLADGDTWGDPIRLLMERQFAWHLENFARASSSMLGINYVINVNWNAGAAQFETLFMHHFHLWVQHHLLEADMGLSAQGKTDLIASLDKKLLMPVGILGGGLANDGTCFTRASDYIHPIGPTLISGHYGYPEKMFANWSEAQTKRTELGLLCPADLQDQGAPELAYNGTWGYIRNSIELAVERGVAGAADANARFKSAPRYAAITNADWKNFPNYSVRTRV